MSARWAWWWSPVVLLGGLWTVLTLELSQLVAGACFFGLSAGLVAALVRDHGRTFSWWAPVVATLWAVAAMGPITDVPRFSLAVLALQALTAPAVRRRLVRSSGAPVERLSDWQLESCWAGTTDQLRRSSPADALALVQRRQQLLDELVRRGLVPVG